MKTYIATSVKFKGFVEYTYNEEGLLACLNLNEAQVNDVQRLWLWNNRPHTEIFLQDFAGKSNLRITEKIIEVTFNDFYTAFGNKVGRNKAEKIWERMSKADQLKAHMYIDRYKVWLKTNEGIAQLHPATYLNQKRWED